MRFLFWEFWKKERREEWRDRMELIVEEVGQSLLVLVIGVFTNSLFLWMLEQATGF